MKGQKKTEIILYIALWAILFATPVISMFVGGFFSMPSDEPAREIVGQESSSYDWAHILSAWSLLGMFCVTFFIHNFLIAPLLVYRSNKWQYGMGLLALIVAFALFQLFGRSHRPKPMDEQKTRKEKVSQRPAETHLLSVPMGLEAKPGMEQGRPQEMGNPEGKDKPDGMKESDGKERPDGMSPPDGMRKPDGMGQPDNHRNIGRPDEPDRGPKGHENEPPLVFGGQDSVAFIIMALLLGLNIGIKYFFKSLDDRKRMKELERENLSNQLAYLKYQINPHFFMNTLNNIHALVDINSEQAKYTIEVLSKMMRYVLYEGNKAMAPLQKEMDFLANYIELMRIRYTDKVRISVSLPKEMTPVNATATPVSIQNVEIPSMLLINFVENAFKHGVSYQIESFIEVIARIDETSHELEFLCHNSRKPATEEKQGGVGLQNTIKRLQLIYGKDGYDLHIYSNEEEYKVLLRLPITTLNS